MHAWREARRSRRGLLPQARHLRERDEDPGPSVLSLRRTRCSSSRASASTGAHAQVHIDTSGEEVTATSFRRVLPNSTFKPLTAKSFWRTC
jgi:hypothetical protein